MSDGVSGPIPWNRIIEYAKWAGLDDEMEEIFLYIIEKLDSAYLNEQRKEVQKRRATLKKPSVNKGGLSKSLPRRK